MEIIQLAAKVDRRTVREMTAVIQAHTQHSIARLNECEIRGKIRIRAAMRLHIGELCAEKLLRTLAGKLFYQVNLFAAAVIALPRVAFGVFIGKDAAHGLHNCRTREVL